MEHKLDLRTDLRYIVKLMKLFPITNLRSDLMKNEITINSLAKIMHESVHADAGVGGALCPCPSTF